MFRKALPSAGFAIIATIVGAFAPAKAVPVTTDFSLTGYGGYDFSHSYEAGGLTLTVSGGIFDDQGEVYDGAQALVLETPYGVGVQSQFFDTPLIDGGGLNEVAVLAFSDEVTLNSLTFSFGDSDDDFRLFLGDAAGSLVQQGSSIALPSGSVYIFSDIWLSDLFGIGAQDFNDQFLLKGVSVIYDAMGGSGASAVPLPASVLLFGSLIAFAGFVARFRSAQTASA